MKALPSYEVFAIRYARVDRMRTSNFIDSHDPHDQPMPMDYFVWVIRGSERTFLVDTGFNESAAAARGRTLLRCPIQALAPLGLSPEDIREVIITHMHYDHAGNVDLLPYARFHLQESEMSYATGKYMLYRPLRQSYSVEDVVNLVRGVYQQRVVFHRGDTTLAPGVELIHIGGHTLGLQAVRVHTDRGWVVLASDASHYFANMDEESPFPIVHDVGAMLDGYQRLLSAASSPDHIVPGHDPLVRVAYPSYGNPEHEVTALHLEPKFG